MKQSDSRHIRRRYKLLARKGRIKEDRTTLYEDNAGEFHNYKILARVSSFCNILIGCLHNGFPVVVPHLWYRAWALWPFFFVRKNLGDKDPLPTLNHERIHVRQQWDILITFAPLILLISFYMEHKGLAPYLLIVIPFLPTLVYGLAMIQSLIELCLNKREITFKAVRENTCFERESISKALNYDYLHKRKFWAVLAYTGINIFKNYGI